MEYSGKQKYKNKPTVVDGIRFDSKKEANRYQELKLLKRSGKIMNLRIHTKWPLRVNGHDVGFYVSDFDYHEFTPGGENDTREMVEDVKSPATRKLPVYRLKKKLMLAVHGIEIREI